MHIPKRFFDRKLREKLIHQFLGLSIQEIRKRIQKATEDMSLEWRKGKYERKPEKFYASTFGYVLELESWHIEDRMKQAGIVAIASQCRKKRFLEYGCGIADTSILASLTAALEVHALDLPSKTLDYAKFRASKLAPKSNIKFIDASSNPEKLRLRENYYEIISAEDVFEHIQHPKLHALKIYESLKKGGSLYFSTEFIHSDFHPMHLRSNEKFHGLKWLYELEKIGFKIISPCHAIKF